jgi:catechol 2,3-dioxygenase-like lactoylglutathione lyase family enzyme
MKAPVLALATAALQLTGADMRVDHITVAGKALTELRKTFGDAGFPTEYGGRHSNGITEMALSSFPDGSYLELIAPITGADASPHYWGAFMAKNAGPCAWAIRSTNLQPSITRLQTAGIAVAAEKAGRKRPDGVELRWQTARVGPPPQGSFFPFMIADETARDLRAYPSGQPTSTAISGVRFVVVAVRDLAAAIAKYRAAFELPAPRQQDDPTLGAHLAWFPGAPAMLAAPSGDHTWLADRLKEFGEIPCAFVFGSHSRWTKAVGGESKWFSHSVLWLDSRAVGGARIAISVDRN